MRVRSTTDVTGLAAAIDRELSHADHAELVCIGAGAVHQAAKALASVSKIGAQRAVWTAVLWDTVDVDGTDRTGLMFVVVPAPTAARDVFGPVV